MQFAFKTAETLELLTGMFKFRPKNPAVVQLNNFCFEVNNNQMFVKIYDLQTMVKVQVPVQIFNCTEPASFMIDAQEIIDFLKSFSSNTWSEFSLDVNMDKETCFLSIPKFKQQIPCYNAEEYPKLTGLPATATSFSISNIELYNIIDKGLEVVANDYLRPAISSLYFNVNTESGVLETCSTNAHCLYSTTGRIKVYVKGEAKHFLLESTAAKNIKSLLPKKVKNLSDVQECKIRFDGEKALMTIGKFALITKLIDDCYPDYKVVIPQESENRPMKTVEFSKNIMLEAIKLVEKSANKQTKLIKFSFYSDKMVLYAEDLDLNKSAEATAEIVKSNIEDCMDIGFDWSLLKTLLYLLPEDDLYIELFTPNKAGIIKSKNTNDEFTLLQPLMLTN